MGSPRRYLILAKSFPWLTTPPTLIPYSWKDYKFRNYFTHLVTLTPLTTLKNAWEDAIMPLKNLGIKMKSAKHLSNIRPKYLLSLLKITKNFIYLTQTNPEIFPNQY